MATLTSTPPPPVAPPPPPPRDNRHWAERMARSGYFLGAVLFHIILFLIIFTWVVFQPPTPPAEDFVKTYVPQGAPPPPPPSNTETMKVPTAVAPTPNVITMNNTVSPFTVPMPSLNPSQAADPTLAQIKSIAPQLDHLAERLPSILSTVTSKWGRSRSNIEDSDGDPHNVVATFPLYVASYSDGDWDCNIQLDGDGKIVAGSLPDLVAKINEWSHGNLKGKVVPEPLDIGSSELIDKMPPFIFFTGHKDFQLTPQEVANLAKYLAQGGAIWGDNALPGYGSRFDVAFRREMKKVIPDVDKQFEDLPLTHDIFVHSWYPINAVPAGMNFYQEPIQHIDLDGKIAILYTPNDYSDMFCMDILAGDQDVQGQDPSHDSPLHTWAIFAMNSSVFFRNFSQPSVLSSERLGMNIIGHLLVRFDKELLLAP